MALGIRHHKSASSMSICIAADWKETLQNQNAGVRSVMTWEGFVSNHQSIRFDNLRVAKRFVQYLNNGYGKTKQRKNGVQWSCECKYVTGCPFLIRLRAVSGSIRDGCRTIDNQRFRVTQCIWHNHDMEGSPLPTAIEQPVLQEERREAEEDMQIPQNMHLGDEESVYVHRNDERLQKSEEWYNNSLRELSTHISNLREEWRAALEQCEVLLSSCRELPHPHVDVVTEITMEEGVMVMNGSKPTNHSDEELSRFIDLITNAIHTPVSSRHYVQASTISIPVEYTSQANNDDGQYNNMGIGDDEEVADHTGEGLSDNGDNRDNGDDMQVEINQGDGDNEEGQGQGQEAVRTTPPVDQQPNSSQRTLRSGTRVNYRLLNDPYSRESRAALAGSGGSGTDDDRAIAQLYITKEDIDDNFRPEDISARDLLQCLENLYLRKYVHGGKDFTPHSRSTDKKEIMNTKARPANIRQVGKEIDGVSEGFVRTIINRELKDSIDCPTALAYLDYLGMFLLMDLDIVMYR